MKMEKIEEEINALTLRGKIVILNGLLAVILFLIISLFFINIISPTTMLFVRLFIVSIGIVCCLTVLFYCQWKITLLRKPNSEEITIIFNGKKFFRSDEKVAVFTSRNQKKIKNRFKR